MIRRGRLWRAAVPSLAVIGLLGCGDGGTEPPTAPAGSRMELTVQPHDIVDGSSFHYAIRASVVDANGMPLRGALEDVTLTVQGSGDTWRLTGPTASPLTEGEAPFPGVGASGFASSARIVATWRDLQTQSDEFSVVAGPDIVRLPPAAEVGVQAGFLLDGHLLGAFRDDTVFTTMSTEVPVGAVRASGRRNEIIAFPAGRPPTVVAPDWTPGVDTVAVPAREVVTLPLSVWVVFGPYADAEAAILEDIEVANQLFASQRLGLRIEAEIIDRTGHAEADVYLDVSEVTGPERTGIGALGFTPGRINVYAIRTIASAIEGNIVLGQADIGGEYVLMAPQGWGRRTFPHELGHVLGLLHVQDEPGFESANLMWAGGDPDRHALTEGQTFRAHYDRSSALTGIFRAVPTDQVRSCLGDAGAVSPACPEQDLRLFPETVMGSARLDPVLRYLAWDCGQAAAPVPVVEATAWRGAFRSDEPLVPGDPELDEYMRARALIAWAAVDPEGVRGTLSSLVEGPEGQLRRTARMLLDTPRR